MVENGEVADMLGWVKKERLVGVWGDKSVAEESKSHASKVISISRKRVRRCICSVLCRRHRTLQLSSRRQSKAERNLV
jgi:hypothetical protein